MSGSRAKKLHRLAFKFATVENKLVSRKGDSPRTVRHIQGSPRWWYLNLKKNWRGFKAEKMS